jgi:hypothetical protein
MGTPAVTVIELTEDELRLVKNALHSFLNTFGHKEADIVHAIQHLLRRLAATSADVPAGST